MPLKRAVNHFQQDPFTDLLFNVLIAFTLLLYLIVAFVNKPAESGIIDPKAEFIITIKWPDNSPDDIDLWVENSAGEIIWFRNTEAGFMHLDRDDRGLSNDTMVIDGKERINPLNQEVVTLRQFIPGEYIVNLHYYKSNSNEAVYTEVRVVKTNPRLQVVFYDTIQLEKEGSEKTAIRFTVTEDGDVRALNSIAKSLVVLEQSHE